MVSTIKDYLKIVRYICILNLYILNIGAGWEHSCKIYELYNQVVSNFLL